jgi:hypothetical protein
MNKSRLSAIQLLILLAAGVNGAAGCQPFPPLTTVLPHEQPTLSKQSQPYPPAYEITHNPISISTSTDTPAIQGTPRLAQTPIFTQPPSETLQPGNGDYANVVLALMDKHALDALEAQKLELLVDDSILEDYWERAAARLETVRGLQPPPQLRVAHEQVIASFELLVSAWESLMTKDYPAARERLMKSYDPLAAAALSISEYLYPQE